MGNPVPPGEEPGRRAPDPWQLRSPVTGDLLSPPPGTPREASVEPERNDDGPRFAYAIDTLLIEAARLNRVIRRLEESAGSHPLDQTRIVPQLMRRIVEIFDAIDALGIAQGGDDEPADGE